MFGSVHSCGRHIQLKSDARMDLAKSGRTLQVASIYFVLYNTISGIHRQQQNDERFTRGRIRTLSPKNYRKTYSKASSIPSETVVVQTKGMTPTPS